jgi:hypothetical protein
MESAFWMFTTFKVMYLPTLKTAFNDFLLGKLNTAPIAFTLEGKRRLDFSFSKKRKHEK